MLLTLITSPFRATLVNLAKFNILTHRQRTNNTAMTYKQLLTILSLLICLNGYGQKDSTLPTVTNNFLGKVRWSDYFIEAHNDNNGYVGLILSSSDSTKIGKIYMEGLDSAQAIKLLLKELEETNQKYSYAVEVLGYLKLNYLATDPVFDHEKSGWQKGFKRAVKKYYQSRQINTRK